MIPKRIHYCWFGGNPLPDLALKCIESWKKFCPDYEIVEWNESNLIIDDCAYAREAYEAKKWAFVSDYARFKILYEEGGVYFDTDVELIKPIDEIIAKGPFMGFENEISNVNPGLGLAAAPGLGLYREILDEYYKIHFINDDGSYNLKTVVQYCTEILKRHGLTNKLGIQYIAGIYIYPKEYFNPMDTGTGAINIKENTISIHHYSGSWLDAATQRRKNNRYRCITKYGNKLGLLIYYVTNWPSKLVSVLKKH